MSDALDMGAWSEQVAARLTEMGHPEWGEVFLALRGTIPQLARDLREDFPKPEDAAHAFRRFMISGTS